MDFSLLLSVASVFAFAEGKDTPHAIPKKVPQVDLKVIENSFGHLVNGLKGIELWRREILTNAQENPKYKENAPLVESFQLLNEIDSYLIKARKYYQSINTLIHSDENSLDAKQTVATISKLRERLIHIKDTVQERGKAFKPATNVPQDSELHLLKAAFDATAAECLAIEKDLRDMTKNSPYKKYLKDIKPL
ncbi:unnamed protein product [Bemisia tabaci]|uniref:Uncharacterized protein n=1 Tax=Bemisia tabaci TaxID=7038 RepID=A0A9P0A2J2_BEMTA|nr:unnamed protein product [Bemisia tabaci]